MQESEKSFIYFDDVFVELCFMFMLVLICRLDDICKILRMMNSIALIFFSVDTLLFLQFLL